MLSTCQPSFYPQTDAVSCQCLKYLLEKTGHSLKQFNVSGNILTGFPSVLKAMSVSGWVGGWVGGREGGREGAGGGREGGGRGRDGGGGEGERLESGRENGENTMNM